MKISTLVVGLLVSTSAWGAYPYYLTDTLTSLDLSRWAQNGSLSTSATGLYTNPQAVGGSLISRVAVPDGSSDYETRMTIHLPSAWIGTWAEAGWTLYARASLDANAVGGTGTYYALVLGVPTSDYEGGWTPVSLFKRVNGVNTQLASFTHSLYEGMSVRMSVQGSRITFWIDDGYAISYTDSDIATGQPGVGVMGTASVASVQFGPADRTAPGAVNATQPIGVSIFPNHVDLQWRTATDDANGVGIGMYSVSRDGAFLANTRAPQFSDEAVSAGGTYTYSITACDLHGNCSTPATSAVTVPTSAAPDQGRVGVHTTGSYWGAAGEQIDLLSGNLNFTVPLLKALGRGGWGVTFALSYNSQIWRQDGGGTWVLGQDLGYGLGWRLQAGSIAPVWAGASTLHHYVFTDASGAEYVLDQNSGGLWTSRDGSYVTYDANAAVLHFPDGSYWSMGVQSSGLEEDAGTLYPNLMEDTNGNQIQIVYGPGLGLSQANTSSRIRRIIDARAGYSTYPATYNFLYTTGSQPHLTQIAGPDGTSNFSYQSAALSAPFTPQTQFGTATLLQSCARSDMGAHAFEYSLGTGELTQVTTPFGGTLQWNYQTFEYSGSSRSYREVQTRQMAPTSGSSAQTWNVSLDSNATRHASATIADQGAGTQKTWTFRSDGLTTAYEERDNSGTPLLHNDYTWAQDTAGRPYVGTVTGTLNPGATYAAQSKTVQTLDAYGNITQSQVYDYGNLTTPARTYNFTYLSNASYTSRYIRNRMTAATVTAGGTTITVASNSYDEGGLTDRALLRHDASYGTGFTYRGNVTSASKLGSVMQYAYDIGGVVTQTTDGAGRTVTVTPSASTDYSLPGVLTPGGNNNLATNISYAASWAVTSVSGANGASATTTYDTSGRPTQTTIPDGAQTNYSYTYFPSANTQTATLGSRWKKTTLDGFGRTIRVETGHDGVTVLQVDTEYAPCACSPLGKLWRTSQPHAPGAAVYWTTYTYDGSGRTVTITAPDGASKTRYTYQGNQITVLDPAGKWKIFTTDAMGNLTMVSEPDPNGGSNLITQYTYNSVNQLTQVAMR